MPSITIDIDSHKRILKAQAEMRSLGSATPNMSEAIRYLDRGKKL